MRILIANPNMTAAMTDLMVAEARRVCRPDTEIVGVSAGFGVPYIATRAEMAIAGHALLDLLAEHASAADVVIVGAFCHAFVPAAKELSSRPVVGLAEAAMRAAQLHGRRIGLIGIGARGRAANEEIVHDLDLGPAMAAIGLLDLSGTDLAADQAAADAAVIGLGRRLVEEDNADVLVLGGSAFSGMAGRIADALPVPLICPIAYATALAEATVAAGWTKPRAGTFAAPGAKPTAGIGARLAAAFSG